MKNVCFKKGLVVGIIVLFLGVSATTSGIDVNANPKNELKEDNEIEPADNLIEVISFISGGAYIYHKEGFIIKHIICDSGDIRIITFTLNLPFIPIPIRVKNLEAERFIGFFFPVANYWYSFSGIAFGSIKWVK